MFTLIFIIMIFQLITFGIMVFSFIALVNVTKELSELNAGLEQTIGILNELIIEAGQESVYSEYVN